jgi:hypothetical protein
VKIGGSASRSITTSVSPRFHCLGEADNVAAACAFQGVLLSDAEFANYVAERVRFCAVVYRWSSRV